MKRKRLVMLFVLALVGFSFFVPTMNGDTRLTQDYDRTPQSKNSLAGIGDNFEDFVDQISSLHTLGDIGTHSVFADLQDYGMNYDQMQEEDTGGTGFLVEDYVDQSSDVDGLGDLGTHTAFANLQGSGDTYDQLSEELPRVAPTFVNSAESWSAIGQTGHSFSYSLSSASGTNRLVVVGVAWEDSEATASVTAITFNSVSMTSDMIGEITSTSVYTTYVAGWYILDSNLPSSSGSYTIAVTVSEAIAREIIVFVTEYTGVEQEAPDDTGSHQTAAAGDTTFTVTANEDDALIVAVGSTGGTTAMTSETGGITNCEDVIDPTVTSQGGAIADSIGVAAGDHTVGWTGLATRSCSIGGVWSGAASPAGYQMDLEVQFTDVADFLSTEMLCIETGIFSGSEDINVTYWSGSSWTNIVSDLTASQWNNFTVSLTSSTFTIKFGGSSTSSDLVQDSWEIDSVLLQYSGIDSNEDFVDSQSDVDSAADIGTHDVFNDLKASDSIFDNMTEAAGSGNYDSTVNGLGDTGPDFRWELDGDETDSVGTLDSDGGTNPNWVASIVPNDDNTYGGDYDGASAETLIPNDNLINDVTTYEKSISLWIDVDTFSAFNGEVIWGEGGTNNGLAIYAMNQASENRIYVVVYEGTNIDFCYSAVSANTLYHVGVTLDTVAGELILYLNGAQVASDVSLAIGSDFTTHAAGIAIGGVDFTLNDHNDATLDGFFDGTIQDVVYWGEQTVLSESDFDSIYTAGTASGDFQLELESQFTGIPDIANSMPIQQLCIEAGIMGSEDLLVQWWNGTGWKTLWSDLTASSWNNVSIAGNLTGSTFTIRFRDGTQSSDSTVADSWFIDSILLHLESSATGESLYQLDLEIGWTAADYDESYESLCIYPVTGGGWPSEDLRVDVWNGAWTNVLTDLTPDQWNNVSISSYLTGIAFEIRFVGGSEVSDTSQDTWEIDAVLLHTWTPSNIPVIDQSPTLDNPSDTDNLYAQYLEYEVTVYVSDQNGFADIDYLEIGLWDDSRSTEYCSFRYDEDTNTFTEEYDAGTYISLNSGSSSATEVGNGINATFHVIVDWDFPDTTDIDVECYVIDTQTENSTMWYEVNWDVETRLDYSVTPSIYDGIGTADRGDLDSSFSLAGTVIYYNSVDDFPSSTSVDVWVSATEYGTNVGPWSDLTLTSGAFNMTCYADDTVGQDTYTVTVVEEGAGSSGADLYYTTSTADTYIADRVQVQSYSVSDDRTNLNDNVDIDVTLTYDYDDTVVTDGTVSINGFVATHQGVGVWRITDTEATVIAKIYDTVSYTGGIHGISTTDQNGQSQQVIWDQIVVQSTAANDTRVNVNDMVEIRVTLWLAYDNSFLGSGDIVSLNGTAMTWDSSNSWFDLTISQASVGQWVYFVNASTDSNYGISSLNVNSQSVSIVWDMIVVQTTVTDDARVNTNDNVEIRVTLLLAYDSSFLGAGDSVTLDGSPMTWDAVNSWFDLTVSQASVGQWSYFVNSSYDTSYGITIVENPVPRQQVIWDSLVITITDPTDQRVDVGTNATGILVSAVYAFDGMVFDGNLILNNSNFQYATPQIQGYTVVVAAGDTYGITAIGTNDVTYCIWDRVRVVSIYADELYHDPNDDAVISVELEYEYDGSPVLAGTFAIVGNPLTHAGSGLWETTVTSGSYQTVDFNDLSSCDATLHGVSVYNMNSNLVTVYWDRLEFYAVSVADDRISIGAGAEILWSVRLESAGISISTGISAQMTGSISLSPLGGFVTGTVSQNSIGSMTYAVTSATLGEINEFSQSTGDITIIWDRIKVVSVTASLLSVNVNQPTEIRATLVYEFDNSPVTDGTVYLDNNGAPVAMVYDATNGYWTASISQTSAEDYSFTIHSVEGNTFGITSLNLDGKSVMIEWVNVAGPAPDTMTLILLGGGVGIVAIGAAVVASKKRKSRKPDGLGEIDATAFGIEEEVTAEATDDIPAVETEEDVVEAEISEPSEEEIAEEDVEPIVPEEDIEEPEDVSVEETEEAIPVTEEDDVPEPEVIPEEAAGGMVTRVELDRDKIWSKDDRDEMVFKFHPEHLPEEVKTKTSQVKAKTDGTYSWDDAVALGNLLALTKDELIELLPEDYIATTTPEKLKRLTKKEIISLIELLRVRDTL